MDFNLDDLGLRTTGRATTLTFAAGRELELHDLELLKEEKGSKAPAVKKLRERHHALARGLAEGMSPQECSAVFGYSASRISILQSDTAFKELIVFYGEAVRERYLDGHTAMKELHLDAAEEIRERLEDTPDAFSVGQLVDLMKVTADRTGLGPSTHSTVEVKHGLADRLDKARARLDAARTMIDVTPSEVADGAS